MLLFSFSKFFLSSLVMGVVEFSGIDSIHGSLLEEFLVRHLVEFSKKHHYAALVLIKMPEQKKKKRLRLSPDFHQEIHPHYSTPEVCKELSYSLVFALVSALEVGRGDGMVSVAAP